MIATRRATGAQERAPVVYDVHIRDEAKRTYRVTRRTGYITTSETVLQYMIMKEHLMPWP